MQQRREEAPKLELVLQRPHLRAQHAWGCARQGLGAAGSGCKGQDLGSTHEERLLQLTPYLITQAPGWQPCPCMQPPPPKHTAAGL
jgi:hypothetical protein